jgi:hypothetical protein
MTKDKLNINGVNVKGRVTLWRIDETTGIRTPIVTKPNQIQVSWGYIAAKQIGYKRQPDRPDYSVSAMYVEYENQTDPDEPIAVTEFARTLGLEYYSGLISSTNRDFLRVPLRLEPAIGIAAASEGATVLEENDLGNQLTFFAQTSGTQGVHGRSFSHTLNSKVYAAALVATPYFNDQSRDIIFARTNFSIGDQTGKEASSQIGITWDISFE